MDKSAKTSLSVTFGLVQTTEPGNAGAAARALAAFGFDDLLLIAPTYRDTARDTAFAVRCGRELLEKARRFELDQRQQILDEFDEVWGTSSLKGQRRRNESAAPAIAGFLAGARGRLLILFGPERDGLSLEWLDCCHRLITLPTIGASLNLAMSVNIIAYELRRQLDEPAPPGDRPPTRPPAVGHPVDEFETVTMEMRREILERADRILTGVGYPTRVLRSHSPDIYLEPLRSGTFSAQQARWLMGLLVRLEQQI